jgi:predicted cupin superfamily sugar epimerase
MDVEFLKRHFNLQPLPKEGGYFAETYRSPDKLLQSCLSDRYPSPGKTGSRNVLDLRLAAG